MSLRRAVNAALARLPASVKGPATFRRRGDETVDPVTDAPSTSFEEMTVTEVTGVPARPAPGDGFDARALVRERSRVLLVPVPAAGLAFAPTSGQEVDFGGETWRVVGASPFPEMAPIQYRVTVTR